jgi:putative toxin-antitoxin system antitoxin component (TIGR02293 family)
MAARASRKTPPSEPTAIERVMDLLGGTRVIRRKLRHSLDIHEALRQGLPAAALTHLIDNVALLHDHALLELAVGMSLRTFQRFKLAPTRPLSAEQSGRAWKFAEILAKATAVLGTQDEAEEWLVRPASGLDQRRPIELLATQAGARLVEDFLERLEYGVYA